MQIAGDTTARKYLASVQKCSSETVLHTLVSEVLKTRNKKLVHSCLRKSGDCFSDCQAIQIPGPDSRTVVFSLLPSLPPFFLSFLSYGCILSYTWNPECKRVQEIAIFLLFSSLGDLEEYPRKGLKWEMSQTHTVIHTTCDLPPPKKPLMGPRRL